MMVHEKKRNGEFNRQDSLEGQTKKKYLRECVWLREERRLNVQTRKKQMKLSRTRAIK